MAFRVYFQSFVDVGRSNFVPWNVDFGKLSLKIAYWIYLSKSSNSSHCARNEGRSQGKLQTKHTWESHLLIGSSEVFVTLSWHNTFAGVFWKKNRTRVVSKLTTTNYISIERLWTADFEKNIHYVCRAFFKKLEARKQKTIDWHSAELIRYQTPSLLQKYCTVSISKDQSLNVCQDFSGFSLVIFL